MTMCHSYAPVHQYRTLLGSDCPIIKGYRHTADSWNDVVRFSYALRCVTLPPETELWENHLYRGSQINHDW